MTDSKAISYVIDDDFSGEKTLAPEIFDSYIWELEDVDLKNKLLKVNIKIKLRSYTYILGKYKNFFIKYSKYKDIYDMAKNHEEILLAVKDNKTENLFTEKGVIFKAALDALANFKKSKANFSEKNKNVKDLMKREGKKGDIINILNKDGKTLKFEKYTIGVENYYFEYDIQSPREIPDRENPEYWVVATGIDIKDVYEPWHSRNSECYAIDGYKFVQEDIKVGNVKKHKECYEFSKAMREFYDALKEVEFFSVIIPFIYMEKHINKAFFGLFKHEDIKLFLHTRGDYTSGFLYTEDDLASIN